MQHFWNPSYWARDIILGLHDLNKHKQGSWGSWTDMFSPLWGVPECCIIHYLKDSRKITSDTEKVADTFNKCFVNIVNFFGKDKRFLGETNNVLLKAIKKYSTHSSILNIKEKTYNVFFFQNVTYKEIQNEINNLDTSKPAESTSTAIKIIIDNTDILANFILKT